MKKNYYYLVAGLPDWQPDDRKTTMTWHELRDEIETTVSTDDLALVDLFYLQYDHANILNKLYKTDAQFDTRGKYTVDAVDVFTDSLRASAGDFDDLEEYIADAISAFYEQEPRPARSTIEAQLQNGWTELLLSNDNEFVQDYARFDNSLRNVLVALVGRKYERDVAANIIGESEVANMLRKSRARDFGVRGEVDFIEQLLQIFEMKNLVEREMRLDALRWSYIDEASFFEYFGIEKIIAAVLKLSMVQRWERLDDDSGRKRFADIISDIKSSYDKRKL